MDRFEAGFVELERAAASSQKAIALAAASAKQLHRAGQTGDLVALHRAVDRLRTAMHGFEREASAAVSAWPFDASEEEDYLGKDYTAELVATAARAGVPLRQLGKDLVAFPVVLRVLAREKAVLLDGRRLSVVRPSAVVAQIVEKLKRKPEIAADRFLEALYSAYRVVCSKETFGQAVTLSRIYEVLTLLPGTAGKYTETHFARDLCLLDYQGPKRTKGGAVLSLPASTGTKGQRHYTFVGPGGEVYQYFAIRFAGEAS